MKVSNMRCAYVAQSEQEKQLIRQVRREERKEERRHSRRDRGLGPDEQGQDQETYLKAVGFDPESMKLQRYSTNDAMLAN